MKPKQYGIEIEYPFVCHYDNGDDDDDDDDNENNNDINQTSDMQRIRIWGHKHHLGYNLDTQYNCHYDGDGIEFATPGPLPRGDFEIAIRELYTIFNGLVDDGYFTINDNNFYASDTGLHIRLDVSDWTLQQRTRVCRLFTTDMQKYPDFIEWMEYNFLRSWHSQYNCAGDNNRIWSAIQHGRSCARWFAHYEAGDFGPDVYTIELRCFAVPETADEVINILHYIDTLLDIAEASIGDTRTCDIPQKLYDAYNHIVNHVDIPVVAE